MGLNPNQALSQLPNITSNQEQQQQQQHPRLNCPRCDSTNTKFCYYNNYSKLQPRHYCRSCKRHWTAGGILRNVPIGGATRKCKRQKTTHNDDNSDDNNDHKVSAPFNGDIDASIFPDILKQVLFQPQIPPLMSAPEDFYTGCSSSNSGSSCSIYSFNGEESMMNLMNGYGQCPIRGQGSLVQSGSYWNCWDGMMEFDAPNESQKL